MTANDTPIMIIQNVDTLEILKIFKPPEKRYCFERTEFDACLDEYIELGMNIQVLYTFAKENRYLNTLGKTEDKNV